MEEELRQQLAERDRAMEQLLDGVEADDGAAAAPPVELLDDIQLKEEVGVELTFELKRQQLAERDQDSAAGRVTKWIAEVTGSAVGADLGEALKSGVILCELANKIKPGSYKKVSTSSMPFPQRENIKKFCDAAREIGVIDRENFDTNDLFEQSNMKQVLICLNALGRASAKAWTFSGPHLLVSDAESKAKAKAARANSTSKARAAAREGGADTPAAQVATQPVVAAAAARLEAATHAAQALKAEREQLLVRLQAAGERAAGLAAELEAAARRNQGQDRAIESAKQEKAMMDELLKQAAAKQMKAEKDAAAAIAEALRDAQAEAADALKAAVDAGAARHAEEAAKMEVEHEEELAGMRETIAADTKDHQATTAALLAAQQAAAVAVKRAAAQHRSVMMRGSSSGACCASPVPRVVVRGTGDTAV
eukprot:SAG22_NODE_1149_length_5353_cov_1.820898_2_plen_424_part_00